MHNLPAPRDFQQYALDQIESSDCDRILLSAPTGAGKAMLFMMIVARELKKGKTVLLLVDRIALIDQLSDSATKCGLSHNIIQGANENENHSHFTIASIQTIFRKDYALPLCDIILIDEAHTMYFGLINYLKSYPGRVIGATATPFSDGLGNVYKQLINCTTAHELTNKGILVPVLPYTFRKIDMIGAKTIGGEWAANEVHKRSKAIYGDVVATYIKCVMGLRSICFCATVAHCEDVATQFRSHNIPVGVFTGNTTKQERKHLLEDFDNNKILILISVEALAKGFDKSYVQCILDLRPLRRSLATYIQMIGRGLRQGENKKECYLLDFTGNIDRFLPDFEDVYFNGINDLNSSQKLNRIRTDKESKNATECPECYNLYMHSRCLQCGYTRPNLVRDFTPEIEDVVLHPVEACKENKKNADFIAPAPIVNLPKVKSEKPILLSKIIDFLIMR